MSSCTLRVDKVEEGTQALLKVLETDKLSQSKILLGSSAPVFLQIDFVKIPKIQKRIIRIPLKNGCLTENSDVCLLVADLIRGRKVNHELTVNHYNKLLQKRGVTDVQKLHVMSSRQIRVDYAQFEAQRKLCNMFDAFLIDNKISNYLRPKLGKQFHRARKWPIPIRMKRKDLKNEILSKLKKTSMALNGTGTTKTVQVGRVDMSAIELSQNIINVCNYISERFPGGWDNIRSLHIKGLRSVSIPIYMSLISRNDVPTPTMNMKRRKRILASEELSTVGKKVTVYRSGRVKVHKSKKANMSDSVEAEDSPVSKKKKRSTESIEVEESTVNSPTRAITSTKKSKKEKTGSTDEQKGKTELETPSISKKKGKKIVAKEEKDVKQVKLDKTAKPDASSVSKKKGKRTIADLEKNVEQNTSVMSPAKKQKQKNDMKHKTDEERNIPLRLKSKAKKKANESMESKLTKQAVLARKKKSKQIS